jgi:hypothetical protein
VRGAWILLAFGCRFGFDPTATLVDAGGDGAIEGDGPSNDRPNRIFLSSTVVTGALGGFAGADATCQSLADAKSFGGNWQALLSGATSPASARFAGSRGWVDVNGLVIADQPASLDFAINPLRVDENGTVVAINEFSFFGAQGADPAHCAEWTTAAGGAGSLPVVLRDNSFQTDTFSGCGDPSHLICAEIGHVAAVAPPEQSGRIAFVTASPFAPGGGLASADAQCQADADDAGIAGTFLAFLTSGNQTAESRFTTTGEPWRRVDGVRITQTADELVGASPAPIWESFIARTANNAPISSRVWTGTAAQHCQNWNSNMDTQQGTVGNSNSARRQKLQLFANINCNGANVFHLICLQQ